MDKWHWTPNICDKLWQGLRYVVFLRTMLSLSGLGKYTKELRRNNNECFKFLILLKLIHTAAS